MLLRRGLVLLKMHGQHNTQRYAFEGQAPGKARVLLTTRACMLKVHRCILTVRSGMGLRLWTHRVMLVRTRVCVLELHFTVVLHNNYIVCF